MPILETSWKNEATALGYENEKDMLVDLYVNKNFSISQIAEILGYSFFVVRRRLLTWGVSLRRRGGANNSGIRKLRTLTDEELNHAKPGDLAEKYGVNVSTVFKEKRFREREKELLAR